MTEAEWKVGADPRAMLDTVLSSQTPRFSDRKFRLFACACGRLLWHMLDERRRISIEVAEDYADNLATDETRDRTFHLSEPDLCNERLSPFGVAWTCLRPNARQVACEGPVTVL